MYRQSSLQCQFRTYACDGLEVTAVWLLLVTRFQSGVEDTRLEAKDTKKSEAKDTKKNPRPRTQKKSEAKDSLSEDRPLEAKEKDAQGQGPRTQPQVFSKKKGLQKSFLGDLQFINVPRIFDWGRPKSQISYNHVIKNFPNRKFLWDKDMKRWKI